MSKTCDHSDDRADQLFSASKQWSFAPLDYEDGIALDVNC